MIRFGFTKSLTSSNVASASSSASRRSLQTVAVQLDYYMSSQFAGIACGMTHQLYEKNGLELKFLPICPVGEELQRVRDHASASEPTIGSVEQNIFVPLLYKDPSLKLKAIAAMFNTSPLCLASLKSSAGNSSAVGAHEDTVELLQRILDGKEVVASPRSTKIRDLKAGTYRAIQAYLTTEVPTLTRELGPDAVIAEPLEGLNGAKLGYSQMLFTTEEDLEEKDKREILHTFLQVTFEGWNVAIQDSASAAKSVEEAKKMCGLDDEDNDHWEGSTSYTQESIDLCAEFVKETAKGGRLGVLDGKIWDEASQWLLNDPSIEHFGIDTNLWK